MAWEREDPSALRDVVESASISVVTVAELLHGVHRAENAVRREKRRSFIESVILQVSVLPYELAVARVHAQLWADLAARGQLIGALDMQIGATALHHGLQVATRNARDFRRIPGLELVVL